MSPDLPGYVGFANLPNQVHRKSVKKGFEFTLMVVGKSPSSLHSCLSVFIARPKWQHCADIALPLRVCIVYSMYDFLSDNSHSLIHAMAFTQPCWSVTLRFEQSKVDATKKSQRKGHRVHFNPMDVEKTDKTLCAAVSAFVTAVCEVCNAHVCVCVCVCVCE